MGMRFDQPWQDAAVAEIHPLRVDGREFRDRGAGSRAKNSPLPNRDGFDNGVRRVHRDDGVRH